MIEGIILRVSDFEQEQADLENFIRNTQKRIF